MTVCTIQPLSQELARIIALCKIGFVEIFLWLPIIIAVFTATTCSYQPNLRFRHFVIIYALNRYLPMHDIITDFLDKQNRPNMLKSTGLYAASGITVMVQVPDMLVASGVKVIESDRCFVCANLDN